MKMKFFITAICILITVILPIHAMENLNLVILSQKIDYQALSHTYTQIESSQDANDVFDMIAAHCSHTTRCILQSTCKQFYRAASINNLNKLIMHNFTIGDDKEKKAFFKALIKTNNPKLITPLLYHAQKEAKEYYLRNAIHEFDPAYHTEEQYLQERYLTPFLTEAINQKNEIMIERLEKEKNIDKEIIKEYYNKKWKECQDLCCFITCGIICGPCLITVATIGSIICCPCLCCVISEAIKSENKITK